MIRNYETPRHILTEGDRARLIGMLRQVTQAIEEILDYREINLLLGDDHLPHKRELSALEEIWQVRQQYQFEIPEDL